MLTHYSLFISSLSPLCILFLGLLLFRWTSWTDLLSYFLSFLSLTSPFFFKYICPLFWGVYSILSSPYNYVIKFLKILFYGQYRCNIFSTSWRIIISYNFFFFLWMVLLHGIFFYFPKLLSSYCFCEKCC